MEVSSISFDLSEIFEKKYFSLEMEKKIFIQIEKMLNLQ